MHGWGSNQIKPFPTQKYNADQHNSEHYHYVILSKLICYAINMAKLWQSLVYKPIYKIYIYIATGLHPKNYQIFLLLFNFVMAHLKRLFHSLTENLISEKWEIVTHSQHLTWPTLLCLASWVSEACTAWVWSSLWWVSWPHLHSRFGRDNTPTWIPPSVDRALPNLSHLWSQQGYSCQQNEGTMEFEEAIAGYPGGNR